MQPYLPLAAACRCEDVLRQERGKEMMNCPRNQAIAGWPLAVAEMLAKVAGPLQKDLLEERSLIRFIVAWCETPSQRVPGVAFEDVNILYDQSPDSICKFVEPSPHNNIYVRIPHPLRDPVLESAQSRLETFFFQTFWCNEDFFDCCRAALALAKRGENIDRCFIGESGGGTGQGLYSNHLAAVHKHNHAFIDPNLWHNEDELRKQLEMFSGAWILTAQEKPDSHKKFREDLYKKLVSADDLAARKPYGYVTKMLRVIGWKRVETNDLLEFKNVSEESFNSIFRRSLVWKAKALFLDADYIAQHYPDAALDGIFPKDPTLRAFLESGPAIAASLRNQLGFELGHSRDRRRSIIEEYASAGFTEKKIRQACGLADRPPTSKPAALVAAESALSSTCCDDIAADGTEILPRERELSDEILKWIMNQQYSKVGMAAKVSETWWTRWGVARFAVKKKELQAWWSKMTESGLLIPARPNRKVAQFFPKVHASKALSVLGDLSLPERKTQLVEHLNADALYNGFYGCSSREANVEILVQFQTTFLQRLSKKWGKRSTEDEGRVAVWKEQLQKLRAEENTARNLLESLEKCHAQSAAKQAMKRRRSVKGPSAEDPAEAASSQNCDAFPSRSPFSDSVYVDAQVVYDWKLQDLLRTRRYASGFSVQKQLVRVSV